MLMSLLASNEILKNYQVNIKTSTAEFVLTFLDCMVYCGGWSLVQRSKQSSNTNLIQRVFFVWRFAVDMNDHYELYYVYYCFNSE